MAQASMIAGWLMLLFKAVAVLAVFTIIVVSLSWVIRSRRASKDKDADLE